MEQLLSPQIQYYIAMWHLAHAVLALSSLRAKRSARARRACALRALGLLLADGAPTVGLGKTFWRVGRVPLTKTDVTRKQKVAH